MLKPQKVALAVAIMVGAIHVVWSLLVALNWAQPLVEFVTGLHFMQTTVMIMPFDIVTAIELIILASIVGYIVGFAFANIWNKVQ